MFALLFRLHVVSVELVEREVAPYVNSRSKDPYVNSDLLKETTGAGFTWWRGKSLRSTLLSPFGSSRIHLQQEQSSLCKQQEQGSMDPYVNSRSTDPYAQPLDARGRLLAQHVNSRSTRGDPLCKQRRRS